VTDSVFCTMNTRSRPAPVSVAMYPALLGALPGPLVLAGLGLRSTMTASYAATGTVWAAGRRGIAQRG
jgi:hypothetical protein